MRRVRAVLDSLLLAPLQNLPGEAGVRLRRWYWGGRLKRMGKGVRIGAGVVIRRPEWVSVGDASFIDDHCVIMAGPVQGDFPVTRKANRDFPHAEGEVVIGARVHIAPFCLVNGHGGVSFGDDSGLGAVTTLYSLTNMHYDPADRGREVNMSACSLPASQLLLSAPVVVGRNALVLGHSMVLPGATVGDRAVVLPFSKVVGRVPPGAVAEGNPAVRVRDRFGEGSR